MNFGTAYWERYSDPTETEFSIAFAIAKKNPKKIQSTNKRRFKNGDDVMVPRFSALFTCLIAHRGSIVPQWNVLSRHLNGKIRNLKTYFDIE